ncbi:NAD/NADP octopine/nopaline dehydrogenase, alpha-helical domain [Amphibacillus marinus]|uniref:NAD/NADP octopine/nopaline dehydrogenase, alpha-helical domain n=1 Tax=Amphibacillus marinus TaxID=872970 RepID=A0A1H8NA79_9BACI|nr:NAD/NADP octopine/nopaline dehydrogenase family protein [Amphibacillus marinus]SEO26505.1 NAD/NADP octopine/nopaline dehydrogenase, alpha-helical domain [Amphibacillus marinus]
MKIGIHSVSSQSGRAYLVDFIAGGHEVYGYSRRSDNGERFVTTVLQQQGIFLERSDSGNRESAQLISLNEDNVGHDLNKLVAESDFIIVAHPSHFVQETIKQLKDAGILNKRIPIILSPSRTFAVPYLWDILGEGYPFVCFSTNPYSCKAPTDGSVFIKRRKRSWLVSLEGEFKPYQIDLLMQLFPQALVNQIPATTSIGNIGAIFHPTAYLLNYAAIVKAEQDGDCYSFYTKGIANNGPVARHLEQIDQIRLKIADMLGLTVFGLADSPNEDRFQLIMDHLRVKEEQVDDIDRLRQIRHDYLREINDSILSAQHWLAYTYDVERVTDEGLAGAISRTKTYHNRSYPQVRYVEEDVPTGLVPIMAIGERLGLDVTPIKQIIDLHDQFFNRTDSTDWRDLSEFSTDFILRYLKGEYFKIIGDVEDKEVV